MLDDAAARAVLGSSVVVTDESAPAIIERAAFVAELASRGVTATIVKAADGTKLRTMLASASVALFAGPPKPYVDAARTATTGTPYTFNPARRAGFASQDLAFLRYTGARATPVLR